MRILYVHVYVYFSLIYDSKKKTGHILKFQQKMND